MRSPKIHAYGDVRQFLADLYASNSSGTRKLSHRGWANRLKWPISYMNDVIRGRKNLTVARAIELSRFLKFDGFETERLLAMTLMQNERADVGEYFNKRLKDEFNISTHFNRPDSAKSVSSPERSQFVGEEIFSDISLLAIFDVIAWRNGAVTREEISNYLYTFPELKDPKVLDTKLKKLEAAGLIKQKPQEDGFEFLDKFLFFNFDKNTAIHAGQYADNFKRILTRPEAKAWIGSGFLMLSKRDFNEFRQRYFAFRNWVVSLDSRVQDYEDRDDSILFQLDMNLFSLVYAPDILDVSLSKWGEPKDNLASP